MEAGMQNPDGLTATMIASQNYNAKAVQALGGLETGKTDNNGSTALMLTCKQAPKTESQVVLQK